VSGGRPENFLFFFLHHIQLAPPDLYPMVQACIRRTLNGLPPACIQAGHPSRLPQPTQSGQKKSKKISRLIIPINQTQEGVYGFTLTSVNKVTCVLIVMNPAVQQERRKHTPRKKTPSIKLMCAILLVILFYYLIQFSDSRSGPL
jgi:hypothetical protein